MTLFRCPRCQQQMSVASHSGDFVHQCNSGITALDQEDKLIIGRWDDYTGSDYSVRTTPSSVENQNLPNKLMGTRPWVEDNAKTTNYSPRGANLNMFRQRAHLEYIEDPNNVSPGPTDIDKQI